MLISGIVWYPPGRTKTFFSIRLILRNSIVHQKGLKFAFCRFFKSIKHQKKGTSTKTMKITNKKHLYNRSKREKNVLHSKNSKRRGWTNEQKTETDGNSRRDGCQSALWDSFAAMLKIRPRKQSHNALWNYLDPVSHWASHADVLRRLSRVPAPRTTFVEQERVTSP